MIYDIWIYTQPKLAEHHFWVIPAATKQDTSQWSKSAEFLHAFHIPRHLDNASKLHCPAPLSIQKIHENPGWVLVAQSPHKILSENWFKGTNFRLKYLDLRINKNDKPWSFCKQSQLQGRCFTLFYWKSWFQLVSTSFHRICSLTSIHWSLGPPATSELCMELSARMPWRDAVWNVTNAWGGYNWCWMVGSSIYDWGLWSPICFRYLSHTVFQESIWSPDICWNPIPLIINTPTVWPQNVPNRCNAPTGRWGSSFRLSFNDRTPAFLTDSTFSQLFALLQMLT